MATIEQRLSMSKIDASEMSNEEKFMTATGMTFYDAEKEKNEWYVPGGAAMATGEETVEADTEEKKEELEQQEPVQNTELEDTHLEEEEVLVQPEEDTVQEVANQSLGTGVEEPVIPTVEELPGSELEVETVE